MIVGCIKAFNKCSEWIFESYKRKNETPNHSKLWGILFKT